MIPRRGQRWVLDNFLKTSQLDILFPGTMAGWLERGFRYTHVKRTMDRIKWGKAFPKEWARTARWQEEYARKAEETDHIETAREAYHRASVYYGKAQWGIMQDDHPDKIAYHAGVIRCYEKVIENAGHPIERVEIPFEGKSVPGLLHLVPGREKAPTVLFAPGMDMIKEDFPHPFHNHFALRGMNVLSIDGPGQGESNLRKIRVTADNYERAGSAAVDYLAGRPEVDTEKIGVMGFSMGSYWAPRIASHDSRIRACVAAMGCYGQKDTIFNVAQPTFKANFMYMSGIADEAEFDAMAQQMELEPVADRIRCPILMALGEYDELCPLEDAYSLFDALRSPKEIWVFEDISHSMGEVAAELHPLVVDWIRDALVKGFPEGHKKKVYFESGKVMPPW